MLLEGKNAVIYGGGWVHRRRGGPRLRRRAPGRTGTDQQETPTVFGMGGTGGSYACADIATGLRSR